MDDEESEGEGEGVGEMVCMKDLSILIVHYNTPKLLRQTLRGIRRSAPTIRYEIIVVDNNPHGRVQEMLEREFPDVRVLISEHNLGFGAGMNRALTAAVGRYFLVFNPDIAVFSGALEKLVSLMDASPDIGILGPKLLNPDQTIQLSCFRYTEPKTILFRRLPFLQHLPAAKREMERYLMLDWDHGQARNVDYLLGACLCVRREAFEQVGGFDPAYFIYFEDQDWCRRFWLAGWRVVYDPSVSMIHYHRRETAEGNFFQQLLNPLTRTQIKSAMSYFKKFKGQANPREAWEQQHASYHQLPPPNRT